MVEQEVVLSVFAASTRVAVPMELTPGNGRAWLTVVQSLTVTSSTVVASSIRVIVVHVMVEWRLSHYPPVLAVDELDDFVGHQVFHLMLFVAIGVR